MQPIRKKEGVAIAMHPTLAVITPAFRHGRFIKRTIDSVLSQNVPCEYVVIDGGSKDETVDILKGYGQQIRWVSEPDRGQSDAINKGLRMTHGEIICWLNSDDVYFPGTLNAVRDFFRDRPDVDMIYGKAHHIDENDRWIEDYPTEPWNFERLLFTCYLSQPAVFFRRRVLDQVGFLDDTLNYCMDYDLWLRIALARLSVVYLEDRVLAGSRLYAATKTLGARVAVHAEINDMLKRRLGRVPDRWLCNYAHASLQARGGQRSNGLGHVASLGARVMLASLRWNRSVKRSLLTQVWQWLEPELAAAIRRLRLT